MPGKGSASGSSEQIRPGDRFPSSLARAIDQVASVVVVLSPGSQRFETALDADPQSTVLVPRVYVQIVDEADRPWARNLDDLLQNAGIIPVGIEHVPRAASLRRFEVRYYKKAEEAGARKIVDALEEVGVPADLVYLNLEASTRVRANHYELGCPPKARQFKLPPLPAHGR